MCVYARFEEKSENMNTNFLHMSFISKIHLLLGPQLQRKVYDCYCYFKNIIIKLIQVIIKKLKEQNCIK